ncbi:YlxR family protein [Paeniglutamicibacter sp. R2-26]|uniref:YlxR family protein n=1 Tax=Paeniglutamicibacter sp. R2-26 TaxID=3144417 RepID=UPI003EE67EA6
MSVQHQPQRTCIGCRKVVDQNELQRWVLELTDGRAVPVHDSTRRLSGRGAWLHPAPECAERAIKRGAFARSFRTKVDVSMLTVAPTAKVRTQARESTFTTVQPESGSEI